MIDIHCHILSGVDDGPKTSAESIRIAKQAAEIGIRKIVATPHILDNASVSLCKKITESITDLNQSLQTEGIDIEILCGAEFLVTFDLPEIVKNHQDLTINRGNYVLIEFPMYEIPSFTDQVIYELLLNDITPIIAHPERYIAIQKNPKKIHHFIQNGALTQVNAGSLLGMYGKKAKKTAKYLLRNKLVHVLASDAHSAKHTHPFVKALKLAEKWVGKELVKEMVSVTPNQIIQSTAGSS